MHQIQLSDHVYQQAQRRAIEAGFKTVDEFIADVLTTDRTEESENLDHLFTEERLVHLDRVSAALEAGEKTHTLDEVQEHFRKKWESWTIGQTDRFDIDRCSSLLG